MLVSEASFPLLPPLSVKYVANYSDESILFWSSIHFIVVDAKGVRILTQIGDVSKLEKTLWCDLMRQPACVAHSHCLFFYN